MADIVQVNQALKLTDQLIATLDDAERQLSSARNWGFLDVLGGGFIVDLIKHSKLGNAKVSMERVNYLLEELKRVLGGISMPDDYRMDVSGILTFADFFFDGFVADILVQSKIGNAKRQCDDAISRVRDIRKQLERYL